jgi:hypothetical protein
MLRPMLAVLAMLLATLPAQARPVVLELFTSQGCSSCPPADELLGKLANNPDTLVLTWPVTFWDRQGWKDTLASPRFTQRQIAYAKALTRSGPFTPQLIMQGATSYVGSDARNIIPDLAMRRALASAVSVRLAPAAKGGGYTLDLSGKVAEPADVILLRVLPAATVPIGRGENSGRTVTYTNVVRAVMPLAPFAGGAQRSHLPVAPGKGEWIGVLVQERGQGRILGASLLKQ